MKKCFVYLVFTLISCGGGNYKTQLDLTNLMTAPIVICEKATVTLCGKNTPVQDYFLSEFKMVIYTDSISCSSCLLRQLHLWEDLVEWSEQYDGALKYYFIFNPPKDENIRIALRNSLLDYPMLLDSLGEFERLNPHLPKNKAMHTFLLDENNNVVLVGNPLHNPKIEKMFKEIVEEKLGKKE